MASCPSASVFTTTETITVNASVTDYVVSAVTDVVTDVVTDYVKQSRYVACEGPAPDKTMTVSATNLPMSESAVVTWKQVFSGSGTYARPYTTSTNFADYVDSQDAATSCAAFAQGQQKNSSQSIGMNIYYYPYDLEWYCYVYANEAPYIGNASMLQVDSGCACSFTYDSFAFHEES
ncbi:hypothetical protein ANO11243_061830 [Dothideomycetidae sp. 11243]|nr:hypothetical protein ANO11243_061830 [fungal sp. No.11243]